MKDFDQYTSENNLFELVRQGEHENQDFKHRIPSALKIARTLSAFSNTTGGRLLVGVRDNGSIAGVKDEDDIYLLESAAELFMKPTVDLRVFAHQQDGKTVWEVVVPEGKDKPYAVLEKEGPVAYFRDFDENRVANAVMKEIWRQDRQDHAPKRITYSDPQRKLIDYMKTYEWVSVSKSAKIMEMSRVQAIYTLALLVRWEVVDWKIEEGSYYYGLL